MGQTVTEPRVNRLDDYAGLLGAGEIAELRALAARLEGRPIQMVNSTSICRPGARKRSMPCSAPRPL